MTVKQLLIELDSDELSEWIVMDRDHHIIPDTYWQTALIAHTVADCCRPLKNNKSYDFAAFLPQKPAKPQTQEERRRHLDRCLGIKF